MNLYHDFLKLTSEKNILQEEPMKNHTTFKIGGPVPFMLLPETQEELVALAGYLLKNQLPFFVMGNGSNLLVSDQGLSCIVIKTAGRLHQVEAEGTVITAMAGALLSKISSVCIQNNLSGFEELSGIPGTLGGAIYMNAGAYGREIGDLVLDVTILDKEGILRTLPKEELEFSYRKSWFSQHPCLILRARLTLEKAEQSVILEKTTEFSRRRKEKQPLNYPSAGSTFKRPPNFFAAKLIEDCGLKGCCVGGAMVSEKHSGFVVNTGGATAQDVIALTQEIKNKVKTRYGVELELEMNYLEDPKK